MATVSPRPGRAEMLRPYVERLAALSAGAPEGAARIEAGGYEVEIDAWVRESLSGDRPRTAWRPLLADGVALRVKSLDDLERFHAGTTTHGADPESDLRQDAMHGFALMAELQTTIDGLIVSGDLEHAKKLTQFRNKLGQGIALLREALGAEAVDEAERLGRELAGTPPDETTASPGPKLSPDLGALLELEETLEARSAAQKEPAPVRRGAAGEPVAGQAPRRSLVPVLAGVLLLLLAVWTAATFRPGRARVELRTFTAADFQRFPAVLEVRARPPSLFLTVDAWAWNRLGPGARRRLITDIGDVIVPAGYTGAHVTDSEGRTVAQWLRDSGVRLY